MVFYLSDSCEKIGKFYDFLSKIPDGCKANLRLYIDGPGGFAVEYLRYLDFFERYEGNITILAGWAIASADANLFLLSDTKKLIKPDTICIIHKSALPYHDENALELKTAHFMDTVLLQKYRKILNEQEYKILESGEDLILQGKRLEQGTRLAEKVFWKKGKSAQ